MSAPSHLPAVLDVAAVMHRYGMRDRRVARRIMDDAGAFLVGRRLVVRLDDLDAYEHRRKQERASSPSPPAKTRRPCCGGGARSRTQRSEQRAPLAPGWWRESGGEG